MVVSPEGIWLHHQGQVDEVVLKETSSGEPMNFDDFSQQLLPYQTKLSGSIVHVILANSLVRYTTLDWQPYLYKQRDWLAVAKRSLREMYGSNADLWRVNISMQGFGEPMIVAAADAAICDALERLANQYHCKLASIEPAFACVVNYYERSFHRQAWLLMVEQNRFVLAQSYDGIWQHFTVAIPPMGQAPKQCVSLVKQAQHLRKDGEQIKLYLSGHQSLMTTDFGEGIEVQILPNLAPSPSATRLDYGYLS